VRFLGTGGQKMDQIGILISSLLYKRLSRGKLPEFIVFYEEAGEQTQLSPCFFRLEDLAAGNLRIKALVKQDGAYQETIIKRPLVIHNRSYHSSKSTKKIFNRLKSQGVLIYNTWNRAGKRKIHDILKENEAILPHLPETVVFSKLHLTEMMEKYDDLIIKPNSGSLGIGTMRLKRHDDNLWQLEYSDKKQLMQGHHAAVFLESLLGRNYIIQQRIQLAEFDRCPFDIRVSVQKNGFGAWQVTGMAGKVAQRGSFVTNVAQGGKCFSLQEIFGKLPALHHPHVEQEIAKLSLQIARYLEQAIENLADIGLDIGITKDGFPMFIECNSRDLRLSFRNAGLFTAWKVAYMTPISYGKFLMDRLSFKAVDGI
jgi:hypothetical protein